MTGKRNAVTFSFKVQVCFLLVISLLLAGFFAVMFSILQKQCTRVMESYNKNIITGISESFSVINESAEKQGMRIIKLPVATSLIYRESDDQSRHALEIHQLGREFDTIAYLDSAVTYNDATGAFEFYRCSAADSARVIENIRSGGKKFYPYTPYITEQTRADGSHGTVITYYCYDYLRDDTMKGVVAINIRQEWLENILGSADADGINIMLCDNNGEIVYNYKKPGEAQVGYNDRLAANPGGSFRARSDGSRCFVTVGALPASDYYIVCEQGYGVIYAGYMSQMRIYLAVTCLIVLVFGFFAAKMLAAYISRPINKMSAYITGGKRITDDVFEEIYGILQQNSYNTFQLGEMKRALGAYREQNNLVVLMNEGKSRLPARDYAALAEFFGGGQIVGIELLSEHSADAEQVRHICRTHIESEFDCKIAAMEHNDYILIIRGSNAGGEISAAAARLKDELETASGQLVSVFVSAAYDFGEIEALYRELRFVRRYELIYSRGCILDKRTIEENLSGSYSYPAREENHILSAIAGRDAKQAELMFDEFLSAIMGCTVDDFRAAILRLTINIQSGFEHANRRSYDEIADIIRRIPEFETMNEVCEGFAGLVKICCREEDADAAYSPEVRRMVGYIAKNFADPALNSDMVADELALSAAYCGKLFREEVGVSISKYLTEYRLKKAVHYIGETDENINAIMAKTGFSNESNFYRQFKKYYGVTPKEYKAISRKKI